MRFFGFVIIALILFVLVVFAGLLIYFTPQRIENIAEAQVQSRLNRTLEFEAAHISLLNGFVFKDISLPPLPDSATHQNDIPLHSFYAKELSLRYSLRELFHRQITITSVLIDSPRIALLVPPTEPDSTETVKTRPQKSDSLATSESPVSLNLNSFHLRNAQITVDIPDSMSNQHIFLSDISCSLLDVAAPQGDILLKQDQVRGHFNVACDKSDFRFSQQTPTQSIDVAGILDAQLDVIAKSLQYIKLNGFVGITQLAATIPDMAHLDTGELNLPVRAELEGAVNAIKGDIDLSKVALYVEDVPWADFHINVGNFLSQPTLHLQIQQSRIPVEQLLRVAGKVAPDSLMPRIYLHNKNAFLSLAGTEIKGTLPDTLGNRLNCLAKMHLRDFGVTLNNGEYLLQDLNFTSSAKLDVGLTALHHPELAATIDIDSLAASLPDSLTAYTGPVTLRLHAKLDDDLMPSSVVGEFKVSNLVGATLHGDFDFGASGGLEELTGIAAIKLTDLNPSKVAELPVQTSVSFNSTLRLNGLDDINAIIDVDSDSIQLEQDQLQLIFAPIALHTELRAGTEATFQNFYLLDLIGSVNDFLTFQANASAALGDSIRAEFAVPKVTLSHEELLTYVPQELKTTLTGLTITGSTFLNAEGKASISKKDTTFNVNAAVATENLDVDYLQLITLNGIHVNMGAKVSSDKNGAVSFNLHIDSTKTSNLPQSVFYDNRFGLAASIKDFTSITVDSGIIDLPDLKTTGEIAADVSLINNAPVVAATINLHQAAEDTIFITQDILYSGENDINIAVKSDTAQAWVAANIKTNDLTVSLPTNISIDRINADINIEQGVDIKNIMLITDGAGLIKTPSGSLLDYNLYRDYYAGAKSRKSIIKIRKMTAMDYELENAHVEAYIGYGRLDVPYLAIDLYGGNIGGALSFAINPADPLDSPYKLSAHFSGINSALLLPTQQIAKEEGLITAHTELTGRGFDITREIDLDGYFYITEIQSKVADNLLRSLDPEGKDSGIRATRLLINRGFKPRLFSFEIRHGYSYPSVSFDQPWYFPVKLSGSGIELGRIPIAFFLQQQK